MNSGIHRRSNLCSWCQTENSFQNIRQNPHVPVWGIKANLFIRRRRNNKVQSLFYDAVERSQMWQSRFSYICAIFSKNVRTCLIYLNLGHFKILWDLWNYSTAALFYTITIRFRLYVRFVPGGSVLMVNYFCCGRNIYWNGGTNARKTYTSEIHSCFNGGTRVLEYEILIYVFKIIKLCSIHFSFAESDALMFCLLHFTSFMYVSASLNLCHVLVSSLGRIT